MWEVADWFLSLQMIEYSAPPEVLVSYNFHTDNVKAAYGVGSERTEVVVDKSMEDVSRERKMRVAVCVMCYNSPALLWKLKFQCS